MFLALGLLILILDGKTAYNGAIDGIELCLKTAIPALFPFFVISSALLRTSVSSTFLEKISVSLLRMPRGAASLLFPCFLGGYPVGAQSVHQMYTRGLLQKPEAERMLAFCSNAGPAFVFGVIGQMFPKPWMPWALWGIHLTGACAAARCVSIGGTAVYQYDQSLASEENLMSGAVSTMGIVCGWIVFFRVLIAFLDRWCLWLLPKAARVALIGMLELSNGCCELTRISDVPLRFLLCSAMLAAGGLCVTEQTISVTLGLSRRYYYFGKMIQMLVSLILSFCLMYWTPLPLLLFLPPLFWQSCKKRSRNQVPSGV